MMYNTESEKIPCSKHTSKGYKKGCKDCFEENKVDDRQDEWHLSWERDTFGD